MVTIAAVVQSWQHFSSGLVRAFSPQVKSVIQLALHTVIGARSLMYLGSNAVLEKLSFFVIYYQHVLTRGGAQ